MDERDRTIVVFGGDEPDYPEVQETTGAAGNTGSTGNTEFTGTLDATVVPESGVPAEPSRTAGTAGFTWDSASSQSIVDPAVKEFNEATEFTEAPHVTEVAGVSHVTGSPEVADTVRQYEGISIDTDVPQDVMAETLPYDDTIVGANTEDYLEGYKQYIDKYEAEHSDEDEYLKAREEAERLEAAYGHLDTSYDAYASGSTGGQAESGSAAQSSGYTPVQDAASENVYRRKTGTASAPVKKREPKYVTRGFLVACMVITMLVSSVLGAFMGSTLGGASNTGSSGGSAVTEDNGQSQLSLSDATGSDLTIAQIVDKNADAVVEILVSGTTQNYFGQMQPTEGAGSGVIVKQDGYIVTNYHVIQGANKVQVTLHNGETYPATIVGSDSSKDIAVIKINASGLTTAEIGDSSTVSVGDTAVAIGNPLGQLGGTATTGIISALDRNLEIDGRTLTLMQTDAAINGGNSGGGLFNSKGQLIGIVDAKSSGVGIEGLAFAIPVNSVIDTINDLIENGTVSSRPVVGITIQDVSDENAQYYQLESAGVYIAQVTGENAQKAGFQQGDRIISLDGDEISDSQTFINKIRSHKAGDTVAIVVSRDGQEIEIRTELEEYTSVE